MKHAPVLLAYVHRMSAQSAYRQIIESRAGVVGGIALKHIPHSSTCCNPWARLARHRKQHHRSSHRD